MRPAPPNNALQRTEAGVRVFSVYHVFSRQPLSLSLSPLGGIRFISVDTPPAPILEAALYTLHMALVFARNCTLQRTPEAAKQANDFMEAVHEIPIMLSHWSRHDVSDLRMHFGCYHFARWPNPSPDLVRMFDTKLAELSS